MGRFFNHIAGLVILLRLAEKGCGTRVRPPMSSNFRPPASSNLQVEQTSRAASSGFKTWDPKVMDAALDRSFEDAFVMKDVRRTFNATSMQREVPASLVPKVAYMFMIKDSVDQAELWQRFFKDARQEAPYSIYVHQYKAGTDEALATRKQWAAFGVNFIPVVKTGWGQLCGVEFALLWEALRDPANAQFVFLSEGHVPLKSANYVYDYLMRKSRESKICFNKHQPTLDILQSERTRTCSYRDSLQAQILPTVVEGAVVNMPGRVLKHHQWVVLARRHAVDVVDQAEDSMRQQLRAVMRAKLPGGDPAMLGASDETFVATALLLASEKQNLAKVNSMEELRDQGVMSECTSFVYWRHCWKGTKLGAGYGWNNTITRELAILGIESFLMLPSEWYDLKKTPAKRLNDSPRDFGVIFSNPSMEYVENLVNAGFLFARKFGNDEHGQLRGNYVSVLPPLWAAFSEKLGLTPENLEEKLEKESKAWPVLDVGDDRVHTTVVERMLRK